MNIKNLLQAFRLQTLPLSLAIVFTGSFLAVYKGFFSWIVFALTVTTIVALQILSNLANDYGDAVSGVDTEKRVGPKRATVSGAISRAEMRLLIGIFVGISVLSGSFLVILGLKGLSLKMLLMFFVLGLIAIVMAIKYTMGKNPYGYRGWGDLFVFIFFGLVGVLGTSFLQTHDLELIDFLPASSIGLLSVGVLNINNLRDVDNDRIANKLTIVVRLGTKFAKIYHVLLIALAMASAIAFTIITHHSPAQYIFLVTVIPFARNVFKVCSSQLPSQLNAELRNLSISTLLFSLLFGIGLLL